MRRVLPFLILCAVWPAAPIAPAGEAPSPAGAPPAATAAPVKAALKIPNVVPDPARVVVVANARSPDSLEVARFYMRQRGIPEANLFTVETPVEFDIAWSDFIAQVFNPLRQRLTAAGWLDAYATTQLDQEGRLRYAFFGHQIDFLVVCYGVPVRIKDDPARRAAAAARGPAMQKEFDTNAAAVDSELALLAASDTPLTGPANNPLFNKAEPDPFTRAMVVRVARLDGPGPAAVRGLVESALLGEARGLQGRAYIDYGLRHPRGDEWLDAAARTVRQLGFDLSEERTQTLFAWRDRFDAPALYFGWWSWDMSGPISDPAFRFPPGAVGIHIHSYSADSLRDATKRWTGALVARGIAATVGNVYEPYLEFTHHPHLFLAALARGATTGEAAYLALPALSWQAIFIGDPLYKPFATGLPAQLTRAAQSPTTLAAYAVIRQMNLLQEQGQAAEARAAGEEYFARAPGLPLAFALALLDGRMNLGDSALARLRWMAHAPDEVSADDLGVVAEAARQANRVNAKPLALELFAKALGAKSAPDAFRRALYPEAIAAAKQAGDTERARGWEQALAALPP